MLEHARQIRNHAIVAGAKRRELHIFNVRAAASGAGASSAAGCCSGGGGSRRGCRTHTVGLAAEHLPNLDSSAAASDAGVDVGRRRRGHGRERGDARLAVGAQQAGRAASNASGAGGSASAGTGDHAAERTEPNARLPGQRLLHRGPLPQQPQPGEDGHHLGGRGATLAHLAVDHDLRHIRLSHCADDSADNPIHIRGFWRLFIRHRHPDVRQIESALDQAGVQLGRRHHRSLAHWLIATHHFAGLILVVHQHVAIMRCCCLGQQVGLEPLLHPLHALPRNPRVLQVRERLVHASQHVRAIVHVHDRLLAQIDPNHMRDPRRRGRRRGERFRSFERNGDVLAATSARFLALVAVGLRFALFLVVRANEAKQ
mmetsp:Transcript_26234/g.84411  ORF Transcript_26234/g.84411 Transcript_26234/m.84411 type:complete len:371 (-) Transcript_26234:834-1946(-)